MISSGILRVALLADEATLAQPITAALRAFGFTPHFEPLTTETLPAPDVVLAEAARWRGTAGPAPVILLTDAQHEAEAIEGLRRGASDYVFTDRLTRLGPAVERARRLHQAATALRHTQTRLDLIHAHTPLLTWAADSAERLTLAEGREADVLGLTVRVGQPLPDALAHWPEWLAYARRALAGETHTQTVWVGERQFEAMFAPTYAAPGLPSGMLCVAYDITTRQRAARVQATVYQISEAAHTASTLSDLFRAIHTAIGALMPAQNFYIALYSAATQTITFPYYVDEFDSDWSTAPQPLGRGLTEYVLRTGQPMHVDQSRFEALMASGEVDLIGPNSLDWIGVPLKTRDTTIGMLAVQTYTPGVRLTEADKDILGFVSNQVAMVIERKQAEERLRASEERFRVLARSIPGTIYLCRNDARYTMLYLNEAVRHLTGYSKEDFLEGRIDFVQLYHPEDSDRLRRETDDAVRVRQPFHLIYRLYTRSGELRWVEEWGTTVDLPELGGELLEGFLSDITQRHLAEEALRQAQKSQSLGVLAGGVAHDFNNLLVAMLGQTSLALARLPADDPARESIVKAVVAAERAADLTRQLLAYSGGGQFATRALPLNQLIHDHLSRFSAALPAELQLRTELAPDVPLIEADAGQMQQVIMNLLLNAAEASGERPGTVTLRTRLGEVGAAASHLWRYTHEPLSPGPYVILEVQDEGAGMDAHTLANLFDPFFTTKFTGRGLGLAAVLGIVRGHHGGLHVETALGRGSTFQLFFPVSAAVELLPPALAPAGPSPTGHILVIDDEESVRMAVADILDMEGLPVLAAADGADGIALYAQWQAEVSLIILDLSMPGLSGEETLAGLRRLDPTVPIILSSGYSQREATRRFAGQTVSGFLQKPYDAEALIAEVRQHRR